MKSISDMENDLLVIDIRHERTWGKYFFKYKETVQIIKKSIFEGKTHPYVVCIPLLHLIRHSIEIGLKMNIFYFERLPLIEKKYDHLNSSQKHNLGNLFDIFENHLGFILTNFPVSAMIRKEIKKYSVLTNRLKHRLANLDSNSEAFRYPEDKNGKRYFEKQQSINLNEYIKDYEEICKFLMFTIDELEVYLHLDMQEDFEIASMN